MLTDLTALFGAGVASFLAPCVVPLVPAYLGMVVGEVAEGEVARVVPATAVFVLGFTAVYTSLGVAAGGVGSSLDDVRIWVERLGGVLVVLMGLALLGVFGRFRMAGAEWRPVQRLPRAGPMRPFVLGVGFGAAWSPCVGPLLGAALSVAATRADPLRGGLLLSAYAMGIGVPFLAASLGLVSFPSWGARLRRISAVVERVSGVLLVALGIALATGLYSHLTSYLARFTPSIGGL